VIEKYTYCVAGVRRVHSVASGKPFLSSQDGCNALMDAFIGGARLLGLRNTRKLSYCLRLAGVIPWVSVQ